MITIQRPTLRDWWLINLKIGTLSFGGAGRLLMYQDEVVEKRHWLTVEEFRECLTLAQALPGPNLVNVASYLGYQLLNPKAALLGLFALCLPGALMATGLIAVISQLPPQFSIFLTGCMAGNLALLAAFIIRLAPGLKADVTGLVSKRRWLGRILIAATVAALSFYGTPLWTQIAVGGIFGLLGEAFL